MAEPTDAVLPILRRIQQNLAETRREVADTRRELGATLADHGERLETIEGYLTYELGLSTRARADIQAIQTEMKQVKKRLAALEKGRDGRKGK